MKMLVNNPLYKFAKESNEIEGIKHGRAHKVHAYALKDFVELTEITVGELQSFVQTIQPGAKLRTDDHHQVRIGYHYAPAGRHVQTLLRSLLDNVNKGEITPWRAHAEYEMIHPFMDGNGRSGRALWLWMMLQRQGHSVYQLSFLHRFYYQTLERYWDEYTKPTGAL